MAAIYAGDLFWSSRSPRSALRGTDVAGKEFLSTQPMLQERKKRNSLAAAGLGSLAVYGIASALPLPDGVNTIASIASVPLIYDWARNHLFY